MSKKIFLILIFISIITHRYWFSPTSIITYGDWYYLPLEALKEFHFSWGTWISFFGFGTPNIQLPYNIFIYLWAYFSHLNIGFDISSKIIFLIPIAILEFIAPYILAKKLTNDTFIALVTAIFYGATPAVMINQLPIQFVYVLSPLILYFFILALEKNRLYYWLVFSLFFFTRYRI